MKARIIRGRDYVQNRWRWLCAIALGLGVLWWLLLFRLGSLVSGISADERQQMIYDSSWHHLVDNPLYLPYTGLHWLLLTIVPHHGHTVARLISPLFGAVAITGFAYVLRRWYGTRTALFGTALFATSAWLLHVSRYGGIEVLYVSVMPLLLASTIYAERRADQRRSLFILITWLAALVYIPGAIWLIAVSYGLQHHGIRKMWQQATRNNKLLAGAYGSVLLLPLLYGFIHKLALLRLWLGLPEQFNGIEQLLRGLVHSVSFFVYRGPAAPELWLPRLPILNFFCTAMLVLGLLFYATHFRAPRTRLLLGNFIVGAILFALGGVVDISLLVPIIFCIVIGGLGYLLHEWLIVFPRNPIARGFGFMLIGLAVALTCFYGLRSYYVAWPHAPGTAQVFRIHL